MDRTVVSALYAGLDREARFGAYRDDRAVALIADRSLTARRKFKNPDQPKDPRRMVGRYLAEARRASRPLVRLVDVAHALGYSRAKVGKVENNKVPVPDELLDYYRDRFGFDYERALADAGYDGDAR